MDNMQIKIAAESNIGLRRNNNEDRFAICPSLAAAQWNGTCAETSLPDRTDGAMIVMADGMGDMNAGEVAADITIQTFIKHFSPGYMDPSVVESDDNGLQYLKVVSGTADRRIKQRVYEDPTTWGMGTTLVAAWIYDKKAHIAWCGDSRAYLYNPQMGLKQLTRDHLYIQELLDAGRIDALHAAMHPGRKRITRYLGDDRQNVRPDTTLLPLATGDTLMLCTDGLTELLDDNSIAQLLLQYDAKPDEACSALIKAAIEAGGNDNITVAILHVEKGGIENASRENTEHAPFFG